MYFRNKTKALVTDNILAAWAQKMLVAQPQCDIERTSIQHLVGGSMFWNNKVPH